MHTLCVSISTHSNCMYWSTGCLPQVLVDNLPHRDYFQSNLPSSNDLPCTLAGHCKTAMPTLLRITHGRWILTAAWVRQVLGGKTGSACKIDTCLDTTSVGDRTKCTTENIKKIGRYTGKKKSYSVVAKFTSMLDASKLEKRI